MGISFFIVLHTFIGFLCDAKLISLHSLHLLFLYVLGMHNVLSLSGLMNSTSDFFIWIHMLFYQNYVLY
jgi:hypothetical protein